MLSVPLPAPVPPRGTIELAIEFRSKLPRIVARTGFVRDFHLVGQWFPKLGVYEPAGMRGRAAGGWNCHAFHANSEFYADYGAFDVTFTVPARFRVGATGRLVSAETRGGQTTYRYVQRDVHDFAWTADPRFLVREFVFDPARDMPRGWTERAAKELGRRPDELALTPVSIRLLLQPDHESALGRYVRSARTALAFYGLWFGAYPYPTLTIVDPPEDGFGAGGMEYPTFVTGGAPSVLLHWPFDRVLLVEDVTVHEIGHQWWYGLVGSNEFEEPWLDEGINSDSEYRALELAYGPRIASLPGGLGFGLRSLGHLEYVVLPNLDPIRRFAWRFSSGRAFGVNSYPKVALFLAQLSNDLGAATFARAERAYFDEWSFRHPSTDDFFAVFERVSGRDLTTYRRNIVEGTARLDWRVVSAATARESEDAGVFERAGKRVTLETGRRFGTGGRAAAAGPPSYVSTVLFGNDGEWAHSAAARLVFEDGKVLDRPLSADARWVRLTARYGLPLAWAAVDPDRRNPWDWDRLNDSKVLGGGRGAADVHGTRAAVRSFGWAAYLIALMTQLLWSLA